MRLIRFRRRDATPDRAAAYGLCKDDAVDTVVEVSDPYAGPLVELGPRHRLDELELLCPAQPSKIVGVGRNYSEHAAELGHEVHSEPILFLKPLSALIPPGAPIVLPPDLGPIHFEGEIVLVVGRRCRHLDAASVRDAILGVTCGNDVSARALQKKDGQWTRAKGFDSFAPVGPAIALGIDPEAVEIETRLNGQRRQASSAGKMIVGPLALLEFISAVMTLEPGDLIFTGTPSGVGELSPGDVVEVEIAPVGVLRNPVEGSPRAAR